jgi:hypothetical protein
MIITCKQVSVVCTGTVHEGENNTTRVRCIVREKKVHRDGMIAGATNFALQTK